MRDNWTQVRVAFTNVIILIEPIFLLSLGEDHLR